MAYNSLYDYYSANGGWNTWDSAQRQADAKAAGISNYTGAADQNTTLLKYLTTPKGPDFNKAIASGGMVLDDQKPTLSSATGAGVGGGAGGGGGTSYPETPASTGSTAGSGITDAVRGMVNDAGQFPDYQEDPRVQALLDQLAQSGADLGALVDRATSELGSVSSSQNEVDKYISDAIETQNKAREANRTAAENQFSREYDYTLNKLEGERTAAMEGGRGNAQQYYAMQLMDRDIEKSLRDLESRKMEAIASGDAKAYEVISGLQLKQLEMRQSARQKYFENIMSVAGLAGKQADIYGTMVSNLRQMSTDRLNYEIQGYRSKLDAASTIGDALIAEANLRISERELDIREAESDADGKLIAPPGWGNFNIYNAATSSYYDAFSEISNNLANDEIDSAEAYRQLSDRIKQIWMSAGPNVTRDAFERAMQVKIDDNGNVLSINMSPGVVLTPNGMSDGSDKNAPWAEMVLNPWDAMSSWTSGQKYYDGLYGDLFKGLIIDEDGGLRTPDGKPVVEKKNN
jgi:hypothetical protein